MQRIIRAKTDAQNFFQRRWGWFLIVIAVVVGTLYFIQVEDQRKQARCQAEYNNAFASNIRIRARLADELTRLNDQKDQATESLLSGVSALIIQAASLSEEDEDSKEAKALQKEYVNLFKAYNTNVDAIKKTTAEVQKTRLSNPVPSIPSC